MRKEMGVSQASSKESVLSNQTTYSYINGQNSQHEKKTRFKLWNRSQ
jgi:hypothetical protein